MMSMILGSSLKLTSVRDIMPSFISERLLLRRNVYHAGVLPKTCPDREAQEANASLIAQTIANSGKEGKEFVIREPS